MPASSRTQTNQTPRLLEAGNCPPSPARLDRASRLIPAVALATLLTFLTAIPSWAQPLVIGELTGRASLHEFTLTTQLGPISATSGDTSAFEVHIDSPSKLRFARRASARGKGALANEIIVRFFRNERVLHAALVTGEVDFGVVEDRNAAREITRANPELRVVVSRKPPHQAHLIAFNLRQGVFQEAAVRRAVNFGIDRERIIRALFEGRADRADGPFNPASELHASGLEQYDYDPRGALDLLSRAGWLDTNGDGVLDRARRALAFEIIYPGGLLLSEHLVRWIKINLNELGLDVAARPLSRAEMLHRMEAGDFDAALVEHRFQEDVASLEGFFGSSGIDNFMGYTSRPVDRYLGLIRQIADRSRHRPLFEAIQSKVNADVPAAFLFFKWMHYDIVNQKRFTNLRRSNGSLKPFDQWEVAEPQKPRAPDRR